MSVLAKRSRPLNPSYSNCNQQLPDHTCTLFAVGVCKYQTSASLNVQRSQATWKGYSGVQPVMTDYSEIPPHWLLWTTGSLSSKPHKILMSNVSLNTTGINGRVTNHNYYKSWVWLEFEPMYMVTAWLEAVKPLCKCGPLSSTQKAKPQWKHISYIYGIRLSGSMRYTVYVSK